MDTLNKLKLLGAAAKYDICAASGCGSGSNSRTDLLSPGPGVCHSFLPDGRCISLFKVLQTNDCQKDCAYCPNRVQRDVPRASFTPDELAHLFNEFYRRNYVAGIFLSSGISNSCSRTMEQLIQTAEILRLKYRFAGYIHLKILPGAKQEYVEKAVQLASRVSINIEAPTPDHLKKLSSLKDFQTEIIERMKWIRQFGQSGILPSGQTTQFIVGAAGEKDAEILRTSTLLYKQVGLRRIYFSAFQPIPGTPLEGVLPTPVLREHRLYQSDFLVRQYGFNFDELYFDKEGNLPLEMDPKMSFAINNMDLFPMEVNKASTHELLRIPGIGPVSARRIVRARKQFRISKIDELKNMGVITKKASPFILINGKSGESYRTHQLELWGGETSDHFLQNDSILLSKSSHVVQVTQRLLHSLG